MREHPLQNKTSGKTVALKLSIILAAVGMSTLVAGCDLTRNTMTFDRSGGMERDDYKRALAPRAIPEDDAAPIPELDSVVSTPSAFKEAMPLVSISVNQTVALRDVLFELANQADIDLELDPQIRGSIIFTARQRPFDEVIGRICEMAALRHNFENGVLRIELDRPYQKTYKIDYLNVIRKAESDMNANNSTSGGTDGISNGSTSKLSTKLDNDFWMDLEKNISQILLSSDVQTSMASAADPVAQPRLSPEAQQAQAALMAPPPPLPVTTPPGAPGAAGAAATTPPPLPGAPALSPVDQNAELAMAEARRAVAAASPPILDVQVPTEPATGAPAEAPKPATFSINKQTGLISVYATGRQHKSLEKYLGEVQRNMTSQVLIEAKILEVSLSDVYSAGIDWNNLDPIDVTGLASIEASALLSNPGASAIVANLKPGNDISAAVSALSTFGTVRALSSPRVTVMNNQMAMIAVGENRVYFKVTLTKSTNTTTNKEDITADSTPNTVLEGVILSVMPSINLDTGEIMLSLKPSVNRIVDEVTDPGVAISLASLDSATPIADLLDTISSKIPVTATKDMDSMVRMQSGSVIVLGGLMEDKNSVDESGVPVMSDIPLVGNLFKSHSDVVSKTELVIFIRATIIPGNKNAHDTDRDLYKQFSYDSRPLKM